MDTNTNSSNLNPASNGMSIEDAVSKIAELERANRGILEDTKAERRKRQELEDKLDRMAQSVNSAPRQSEVVLPQDSLKDVEKFATNPRGWVMDVLQPTVEPLIRSLAYKDAVEWLAEQEDTRPSKIRGSKLEQELQRVAREHNLGAMDIVNGTQAAYKIYKAEQAAEEKAKSAAEATRVANIEKNSTESSTVPVTATSAGKRIWKISEIPTGAEYDKHRDEILAAQQEGRIVNG